jgi:phosphatidate phosphatase
MYDPRLRRKPKVQLVGGPTSKSQTSTKKSKLKKKTSPAIQRIMQIIFDFVFVGILGIIFVLIYLLVEPSITYMTCNQTDIIFPYKKDTIELWLVGLYGALPTILLILVVEVKNAQLIDCLSDEDFEEDLDLEEEIEKPSRIKFATYLICVFHAVSLFVLGVATTMLITEIGKRWIGRPRPYFLSVCNPDITSLNCTMATGLGKIHLPIYTGDGFCQGDSNAVKEARLSFPSGHSSYCFYCMCFMIIYLEARLKVLRLRYLKAFVQIGAFIAMIITSFSRVSDYHHRYSDVFAGASIGTIVALFIMFQTGQVLWHYEVKETFTDVELREKANLEKYYEKQEAANALKATKSKSINKTNRFIF